MHTLVKAINNCPKVYFLDDELPIFLLTDASDYGIGAYLFQMITRESEGKEIVERKQIAFMSKSLNSRESR